MYSCIYTSEAFQRLYKIDRGEDKYKKKLSDPSKNKEMKKM